MKTNSNKIHYINHTVWNDLHQTDGGFLLQQWRFSRVGLPQKNQLSASNRFVLLLPGVWIFNSSPDFPEGSGTRQPAEMLGSAGRQCLHGPHFLRSLRHVLATLTAWRSMCSAEHYLPLLLVSPICLYVFAHLFIHFPPVLVRCQPKGFFMGSQMETCPSGILFSVSECITALQLYKWV